MYVISGYTKNANFELWTKTHVARETETILEPTVKGTSN